MTDYIDGEAEVTGTPDEKLLEVAKRRFKRVQEAEQGQREREADDLRFQQPELQWDESARRARLGMVADGIPQPARPVLSISKIDQPIQIVLNQERASKLGVSIQPLSAEANEEVAAVLEGIYRRIERDSQAHQARSWAFSRAVMCGRGAYRINTEYDDTSDDPLDQRIVIERIFNQDAVYFDPAAQKPDCSDGNYAFVASWVPLIDFKAEFPNAEIPYSDRAEFVGDNEVDPDWIQGDGETAAVRVVEYFWKEKTFERVEKGERKREVVTVKWAKLSAWEVLEQGEWNGVMIPLVPVYGRELHPFDAERRWIGLIGPAKDAQRLYNYAASTSVELAALEPKAPWIGVEGQFEGHEAEWEQANIRNLPYLEYRPVSISGQPAPPPMRAQVDVGRLGPAMSLLQQADQFLQITTATYDPSLGRLGNRERSGRAIMALQEQGEQSNSHFMHNLVISMTYEAKCVLDMIPRIYDRPGRIARTLSEEDETDMIMLNAPFTRDGNRRPIAAPAAPPGVSPPGPGGPPPGALAPGGPPPGPGGAPAMPPMPPPPPAVRKPPVKEYDLKRGTYTVAISIGKTRQTALQEGAEEIGQILTAQPQLMPLIGPLYFRYRDFPGAKEIAELLAKVRDKQFPGLNADATDDDGVPTPEAQKAQIDALRQQVQQMGMQLQGTMKALETEQAKQQARLLEAQLDAQTRVRTTEMDNQTKLQIAQIQAETKVALEAIMAKLETIENARGRGHDSVERSLDRMHSNEQGREERTHDAIKTATTMALPEFRGPNTVPLEEPPGGKEV